MEWVSGNIFIRPNSDLVAGSGVLGHAHNFDHTTFVLRGWIIVRGITPDGRTIIQQFCSTEYRAYRELQLKYELENVKRPIRMPDTVDEAGNPRFDIRMIGLNDETPEGGVEIPFEPVGYFALIKAEVIHELIALSEGADFTCVYSHREPQGDVTQVVTGWTEAYH